MPGGEVNPHPIQLVVNYWEQRPSQMRLRLDELMRHGVNHVATFIPWQAVESDISHRLTRFLQLINDRKMTVSLIVTPEVGIHYPSLGLPKDVISRKDNHAQHAHGGAVTTTLAPNIAAIPSFFSAEFVKRYYSYLARMDSYLADLGRSQGDVLKGVNVIVTGGYWKYYRSPRASCLSPFAGPAGDFSGSGTLAYRQRMDQFFGQAEFSDPTPAAANRWKTRNLEDGNRRWFYQHSEEVFRHRSFQYLRKKASYIPINEIELYTPEADPGFHYSQFLQLMSGANADFARLSSIVDESVVRSSMGAEGGAVPCLHWTALGGFRTLSDSEKQFLILKSLLLVGGQGGTVFIDASEWEGLSSSFRARTESLARSIGHSDLRLKTRALYLSTHLWSGAGYLWEELFRKVGPGARLVSSLDRVQREKGSPLLVVDPQYMFTREAVVKLVAWAKTGRVVVIPRSALYTESARAEFEKLVADAKRIEIDLGMPYRLYALGRGKLIAYDLPEGQAFRGEVLSAWQTFLTAILSVAEVQGYCRVSDSRLNVVPMERRGGGLGLFVLNGSRRKVAGDLVFPGDVSVSDLTTALSVSSPAARAAGGSTPSNRFGLEVPPCGIFPLAVDGIGMFDEQERSIALEMSLEESSEQAPEQIPLKRQVPAANAEQAEAAPTTPSGEPTGNLWN